MSMDAVSDMLVLFRTKYFIRPCLFSYFLETAGKYVWFESIDVFVLESGEYVCVVWVSCVEFEVVAVYA